MKLEVYKITNKQNGKIYIGITNQGVATRWYKHTSDSRGNSTFPLHSAIRKYGVDNFQIEVIEELVDQDYDLLKERECYWIKEFNSYDREKGYNLTLGGNGTFGRFHSDKTKDKIRQKALGRHPSDEVKKRMSESHKNRIYDHEEMSNRAKSGNKKRWSNNENIVKAHMSNYNNRCILQYDLEGNIMNEYISVSDASRKINKSRQSISKVLNKKAKSAYGFIWKYKQ